MLNAATLFAGSRLLRHSQTSSCMSCLCVIDRSNLEATMLFSACVR